MSTFGTQAPKESSTCGPGRKRCEEATDRILRASFELLSERGWDGFTIEGVAGRAGVGKATVYRWWPDRATLAVESFLLVSDCSESLPDTGCLASDLKEQVYRVVELMTPQRTKVLRAVFVAVQESDSLREAFESGWSPFCMRAFETIVDRAVGRGQVPADVCPKSLFEIVFGPVFLNLMMGRAMSRTDVDRMVDLGLNGFRFAADGGCGHQSSSGSV